MYVGVDIGGTKTLLASLNDDGVILNSVKFPTAQRYDDWLSDLEKHLSTFELIDVHACGVGVPGRLNLATGTIEHLGHLPWKDEPIQADVASLVHVPTYIENDANLAGLSEAMLHKDKHTVLYVTISTGIGTGIIENQHIADHHSEGGHMLLPFEGTLRSWESFAAGSAIVERYGKRAEDIHDEQTWREIAQDFSLGFLELIAILEPDLIVIGGSVGTYFDRYHDFLVEALKRYETPLVPIPPIVQAERPEQAVVYGCYDYAKQQVVVPV